MKLLAFLHKKTVKIIALLTVMLLDIITLLAATKRYHSQSLIGRWLNYKKEVNKNNILYISSHNKKI